MKNVLAEIVHAKRHDVARRREAVPLERLPARAGAVRGFAGALGASGLRVIAELKRKSPSKGVLREPLDVAVVARDYEAHGAAALSVLTDAPYFGGSDADLRAARAAVGLPVLRKDFTVDPYQIHEAHSLGADAILLIVAVLDERALRLMHEEARALGLGVLVEAHSEEEVRRGLDAGAEIVGINNRDLVDFSVSLETCLKLRELIPAGVTTVAESGIQTRADFETLQAAGFDAILVGEAFMKAASPGEKLAELRGGDA